MKQGETGAQGGQRGKPGLRAYQFVLDVASVRMLRQTRCSAGFSVPPCVRYSLTKPEAPGRYRRRSACRCFPGRTVFATVLGHSHLTASLKIFEGSML